MVRRRFWISRILSGWNRRSVIWLSGVRRVGKTFLCKSIPDVEYFDCEIPRVRRFIEEFPDDFLKEAREKKIVIDEIHRLSNPSEILKIAADHFPDTRIVATGSSTLGASKKFRDTLVGRKEEIYLTPIISNDMKDFKNIDIKHRFYFGGLPPFFMSNQIDEREFQEWIDAYWSKDIMELFRLERRYSFIKFTELLFTQSGQLFEATKFSRLCEVSRTTILNYLAILENTYIVHIIRPYTTRKAREIVAAPKVYAFDTGFVCYYKGWKELRDDDFGYLWEHFVLNELYAHIQNRRAIFYWRDKQGHEIDFIFMKKKEPIVIECKWSLNEFNPKNIISFRKIYPKGDNYIVLYKLDRNFKIEKENIKIEFLNLEELIKRITGNFVS
ncbi:MAG: DUF4143 domain-containing protein [Candidatus Omnitrophica bacterium]|nr:DUF4143 domain-containing protein [Candidatus Omnitrophota bacterium]